MVYLACSPAAAPWISITILSSLLAYKARLTRGDSIREMCTIVLIFNNAVITLSGARKRKITSSSND